MLFANLCAGKPGNQPQTAADLGNALPLRLGFTLVWSGWDPGAPRANGGLGLDAPVATDNGAPIVRRIREEFVSGTRGGDAEAFRLSYEAASARRRRADGAAHADRAAAAGARSSSSMRARCGCCRKARCRNRLDLRTALPGDEPARAGHRLRRDARHRQPSAQQRDGRDLLGRQPTHALAFGISQAGRYLRDHIAQGFNRDEDGARVFDGVFTHVAGIGRVFFNTRSPSRPAPAPGTRTMTSPRWNFRSPRDADRSDRRRTARCCAATTAIRS